MRHPKVSVIMPVYNGEKYLQEAIESICCQTFTDFEFIIVNDGSNDGTRQIIEEFALKDSRIKLINQSNAGIVAALNCGLEEACGEYIARMDADDISCPERLLKQITLLDQNPSLVVCGSYYNQIGARKGTVKVPYSDAKCKSLLFLTGCFVHPTVMIRAAVLRENKITYRSEVQYAEDYGLWSDLACYGKFQNIRSPLLYYRVHSNQISVAKINLQRKVHTQIALKNLSNANIEITAEDFIGLMWPEKKGTFQFIRYPFIALFVAFKVILFLPDARLFMFRIMSLLIIRNSAKMAYEIIFGRRVVL